MGSCKCKSTIQVCHADHTLTPDCTTQVACDMACCCSHLQGHAADLSQPEQRQQLLTEVRMGQKGHFAERLEPYAAAV